MGAGQNGGKRGETPETLNVRGGSQAESVARGPLHCGKTARPEEGFSARGKNPMLPSAAIWHPEMMVSSFSQIDPDTAILQPLPLQDVSVDRMGGHPIPRL